MAVNFVIRVWTCASNQLMSASPTFTPNSVAIWPSTDGTTIVCTGITLGVPSNKWYPGAFDTLLQKFPRWKASMYWVFPKSVPPWLKSIPVLKIGDARVFAVTVCPFESTCDGLKVLVVVPVLYCNAIGIKNTGTVVETPVVGAVPTMLY